MYCGINWCTNYELNAPNVESHYITSGTSLQARGCSGVTNAWRSVHNSATGAVYAVAPVPL